MPQDLVTPLVETDPTLVLAAAAGLLGLILGSFLNVCALRWSEERSVVTPRSSCPECGARLTWHDIIPVLSWVLLRGRCRHCGARISVQYPMVELTTGIIWAGMFLGWGVGVEAVRGALFFTILLGIAVADARFYIIPDQFSVGGAVLGILLAFASPVITWQESVGGAVAGLLLLWFVAWAGEKVFRKEAMGGGDIKMMAMVGAFVGPWGMLLTLFLGSVFGAVIFGPIAWKTGRMVPFGVFLALGGAVTWIWAEALLPWYLR